VPAIIKADCAEAVTKTVEGSMGHVIAVRSAVNAVQDYKDRQIFGIKITMVDRSPVLA